MGSTNEITIDHIAQAVEWAKTAEQTTPIDGVQRKYDQSNWDCGTSCCVWGAASLIAGNGPATTGPSDTWGKQSTAHCILAALMNSGRSTPEQFSLILSHDLRGADLTDANLRGADLTDANLRGADLRGADLRGADLRGADLTDANLRGADLRGADLTDADLRGADLTDADLTGAIVTIGNVSRTIA